MNQSMTDKTILVTRSSMPPFEEYCNEIKELWESHWLTNMGAKHQLFQKELEKKLNVNHITLYTNGHMALEGALSGLHMQTGGEIITTPFTFISTTNAIRRCGFKPVFCDIEKDSYTIDASKIEKLITDKTVAIMPVHVYGNICNVEKIQEIADKYGLKVIYDAAHAFGVSYHGRSVADFGDVTMFSFHATKVFNTIEGGCLCYKDESLREVFDAMKNFGGDGKEDYIYCGGNAKMSEFQAAMGLCNLRHLEDEIQKRKLVVDRYNHRLINHEGIEINKKQAGVSSNYAYYPVVFWEQAGGPSREKVLEALAENNIYARKYFYPLTSEMTCNNDLRSEQTPIASEISKRVLTLPLYADLTMDQVDKICDVILSCKA